MARSDAQVVRDALIGIDNVTKDARDILLVLNRALQDDDGAERHEMSALAHVASLAQERIADALTRIEAARATAEAGL